MNGDYFIPVDKTPKIIFSPELGIVFGVCGALLIQQIHYWNVKKGHRIKGHSWVYNTQDNWASQLMVYTDRSVRASLAELAKIGVVLVDLFNKKAYDRTRWYRLNYEKLCEQLTLRFPNRIFVPAQNGHNFPFHSVEISSPIPEINTETNPETNNAVEKHTALGGIPSGKPTPNPGEKEEDMKGPTLSAKGGVGVANPVKTQPHEVLVAVWREVVPKYNEDIKIVGAFTQKELERIKKIATALGKDGPAILTMILSNWLDFTLFVRAQRDLKSSPHSPVVGFVLSHVALALNFYLKEKANADEQAGESVSEIKVIAPQSSASLLGQVECISQNKPGKIIIKAKPKVGDAGIKEQVTVDEGDHPITLEELLAMKPFGKK